MKQDFKDAKTKLEYYFRLLIKLSQIFEQGQINFNCRLIKIFDYYLHGYDVNVEIQNNEMILRTKAEITLQPFSMIKLKFDFFVKIAQMLRFTTEENLGADCLV